MPVGYDSAGGELILGWRKSALFLKSPLSERQQAASSDFLKTVLAEFRQPRSQPPTKPGANRHPSPRLFGSGREVVVGVWGDWRKWGLMRAGGVSGFPGGG